ncbi:MAG: transposase [Oscillospiraceae bacterium]|nr:transposase [Oscillospiraceae bacterium]
MAEIGDVRRFTYKKSLAAFAGVDPMPNQYGEKNVRSNHSSKRGSPYLRKTLFNVMGIYLKCTPADEPVYQFLDRKRSGGKLFYEKKPGVRTIRKGDGSYTKYTMHVGKAQKLYDACRVSYVDPKTGKCIAAVATREDARKKDRQQLEITAKVRSIGEAQAKAEKYLRLYNKFARTMVFTMPGDPTLAAGQTVDVSGWGAWAGRYVIARAVHTVGPSGYTTRIELRKALEGA